MRFARVSSMGVLHAVLLMVSQELRQVSSMPERLEIGFVLAVWDCRLEQGEKALKAHVRGPTLLGKPLNQQHTFAAHPEFDSERTPDGLAKPLVKATSRVRVELFKNLVPRDSIGTPEKPPKTAVCLGQRPTHRLRAVTPRMPCIDPGRLSTTYRPQRKQ